MTAEGGAMRKAPEAFRTISEAAELLDTPAHVLRFWESKFPQVKPVKRAGGRRYYRRVDIDLLSGIKLLLHDQGMTIRGVQKLLAEKGPRHVAELAPFAEDVFDADVLADQDMAAEQFAAAIPDMVPPPAPVVPEGTVNAFAGMGDVPVSVPAPMPARRAPHMRDSVHAAHLAHLLRTNPPVRVNLARLQNVATKLERLVARLTRHAEQERAR
jgi:DNA-binding transcriptional MerR regulator